MLMCFYICFLNDSIISLNFEEQMIQFLGLLTNKLHVTKKWATHDNGMEPSHIHIHIFGSLFFFFFLFFNVLTLFLLGKTKICPLVR